jgi:hypothetical protein
MKKIKNMSASSFPIRISPTRSKDWKKRKALKRNTNMKIPTRRKKAGKKAPLAI